MAPERDKGEVQGKKANLDEGVVGKMRGVAMDLKEEHRRGHRGAGMIRRFKRVDDKKDLEKTGRTRSRGKIAERKPPPRKIKHRKGIRPLQRKKEPQGW